MWLNYNDLYCVSDDGLVMNRNTGLILTPRLDPEGRLRVDIHRKNMKIHRMVAERFCPKIDLPGLEVDHINRDQKDNRACNLRWVDKSTNQLNKNSTNISKEKNGYQVQFRKNGKHIHHSWHKTLEEATAARDAFRLSLQKIN